MALESLDWKSTRKTPERLARKAKPNLSESVLHDPGREERRSVADLVNILSGLPGAEVAVAKMAGLGALPMLGGVVKSKGGNWLSGSVEDALRGLRRNEGFMGRDLMNPDIPASNNLAINQWIEGPLTKYVKTRMASPDDEVRRLAEEGVLHFEPAMIRERSPLMEKIVGRRETAGFPIQGIADAPLARNWENTSDSIIRNLEARDLSSAERAASFGGKSNIPGDTIVHEMNPFASGAGISDLGFPHLIDELSNALNPASGLPRNLQLSPEAMQNLSMEKAVRRVADINAWRAAQKVEANRKLAEQASIVREYAENNPKGLRWVELKVGEHRGDLPANFIIEQTPTGPTRMPFGVRIDEGGGMSRGLNSKGFESREKAEEAIRRHLSKQELEKQLKYEGDVMQHCVGGYCDDVLSGRSRIFSLRDAKGEPHVTVEVGNGVRDARFEMPEEMTARLQQQYYDEALRRGIPEESDDMMMFVEERMGEAADKWAASQPKDMPRIVQIKGKQNRAPNEEYLPFVQDFVRNNPLGGQWSHVGDLGNTGLRDVMIDFDIPVERLQAARETLGKYATQREIENFLKAKGFASGGAVQLPPKDRPPITGGVRGNLPDQPDSGYNSNRPSWDIFGAE